MLSAGKIELINPEDPVLGSSRLRVELVDENGLSASYVDIVADAIGEKDEREAVLAFAFNVDESQRKASYLKRMDDDEINHARAYQLWREDLDEWGFRRRKSDEPYKGLGDDALRRFQMQR